MKEVISMKEKSIILLLIIVIVISIPLAGCNSKNKNIKEERGEPVSKVDDKVANPVKDTKEEIVKDFKNILKSNNEPIVLVQFIDENIKKVEKDDALEMVLE